jgi:shikimate dehydrogenase
MNDIFVLFGYPLEKTLSPTIHNSSLASGLYFAQPIKKEHLGYAIQSIKVFEWKGANVTIPHKQEVMKYLDIIDKKAKATGAVNTIKNENGQLRGFNTDIYGFQNSLNKELNIENATIIGAGGAARAVIVALIEQGCNHFSVINRSEDKAMIMIDDFKSIYPHINFQLIQDDMKNLNLDILVNCTPLYNPHRLFRLDISKYQYIYDLKYDEEIDLLKAASINGVQYVQNGLEMLILQAAYAQEIWTGEFPNLDVIRESLK